MEIKIEKLHKQAVDAAIAHDWDKAIELNVTITGLDPENTDAFLGLGYAYMQNGDYSKALKHYKEAVRIDPANVIARNNIDKLNVLTKKGAGSAKADKKDIRVSADMFMHIEGKTRVVSLSNVGQIDVIAKLKIGEQVELKIKKRRVEVRNSEGEYIGCLPDDLSKRLVYFLEAKSKYIAFVKSATKGSVDVFIKELRKGAKVKNLVSFPDNIQDDMKMIIGKKTVEEPHADDDEESEAEDDDSDEVLDLEELASQEEDDSDDDDFISDLNDDDDDMD